MSLVFKELLDSSRHVVVFSGAGVSTASGIPDFQTIDRGWKFSQSREQVISLSFFRSNPEEFWAAYRYVFGQYTDLKPNAFHKWEADLQKTHKVSVITQNVDGLDYAAGVDAKNIIEIHGNLRSLVCLNKRCRRVYNVDEVENSSPYPVCLNCEAPLKPNTVLFEEKLQRYREAEKLAQRADLLIVAGTSLNVGPANLIPYNALNGYYTKGIWLNTVQPPRGYDFDDVIIDKAENVAEHLK